MSTVIFVDGEFKSREEAVVNVYDHGLLYGDGIYEGLRCYSGYVFQLEEHLDRLLRSAKSLRIELPYTKEQIGGFVTETLARNELMDAYIRLIVTRGVGPIGPDPRGCKKPGLIIIVENLPNVHGSGRKEGGISAAIVPTRRDPVDATTHEIKSLNYMNSIMAKIEAADYQADDAIMLDARGFISESTICNVFIWTRGKLLTPGASNAILSGITRQNVLEIAREMNVEVEERDITPYELIHADEVFLTGTHAEIVGVVRINNMPVSNGKVGDFTRAVMEAFSKRTGCPEYGTAVYGHSKQGEMTHA
ncbi:branched-chain-amino-acid transaminase [Paenibacillus sambharensis]|uniref:branched-chain-amino-acid transaminase n=1 Tax=Paenibacillus sambharensis TaxID=1803190 RepID=UPI001C64C218|nr:branched-chain-amino-acid transaminase [Paenibacillus sambharensis]